MILSKAFLDPWVLFRDELPLTPGTDPKLGPGDKDAMTTLVLRIYEDMDSMCTSKYDRPLPEEKKSWTPHSHFECLIYQAVRNLARPGHPFATPFSRPNLRNESGRTKAHHRIRGLVMLSLNLVYNYTCLPSSNVIRQIEKLRPAKDPRKSPIKEIRVKYILDNLDVGELRKKVLDGERQGENEREWLIKILMGKEGCVVSGDGGEKGGEFDNIEGDGMEVKDEGGSEKSRTPVAGAKRMRDSEETVAGGKRAKPT